MAVDCLHEILEFWFPELGEDAEAAIRQVQWWFRGGSNGEIRTRFVDVLAEAERGELEEWQATPRSRLALIVVLDQFSRAIYANDPRAYRNDDRACEIAREGLEKGHYSALTSCWEKTFFSLPFGHSERLVDAEKAVELAEQIAADGPESLRPILTFSADQARGHRDVLARFGRHPHRNAVLGRVSTPDEKAYLEAGELIHKRAVPGGGS